MKTIYVNYDDEFYVNTYSYSNESLNVAFIEDDFEINFGYTKVKTDENGNLILYNQNELKKQYLDPSEEEKKISNLRLTRKKLLEAFDKYKSNVNYGIVVEDEYTRAKIVAWYSDLLNLVESAFEEENIPREIKYYL